MNNGSETTSKTSSDILDYLSNGGKPDQIAQENFFKSFHIEPKVCCIHHDGDQTPENQSPEPQEAGVNEEFQPQGQGADSHKSPQSK